MVKDIFFLNNKIVADKARGPLKLEDYTSNGYTEWCM